MTSSHKWLGVSGWWKGWECCTHNTDSQPPIPNPYAGSFARFAETLPLCAKHPLKFSNLMLRSRKVAKDRKDAKPGRRGINGFES